MEMSPTFPAFALTAASAATTRTFGDPEGQPEWAVSGAPNIAFYFRTWPFPVDMAEAATGDVRLRSWHERLASYREASRSATRDNAPKEVASQPPTDPSPAAEAQDAAQVRPHRVSTQRDAAPDGFAPPFGIAAGGAALNQPVDKPIRSSTIEG